MIGQAPGQRQSNNKYPTAQFCSESDLEARVEADWKLGSREPVGLGIYTLGCDFAIVGHESLSCLGLLAARTVSLPALAEQEWVGERVLLQRCLSALPSGRDTLFASILCLVSCGFKLKLVFRYHGAYKLNPPRVRRLYRSQRPMPGEGDNYGILPQQRSQYIHRHLLRGSSRGDLGCWNSEEDMGFHVVYCGWMHS